MSGNSETSPAEHQQPSVHSHGPEHGYSHAHGTLKGYLTGFVLAIILTVIPFWLVMGDVIPSTGAAVVVILGLGVIQIFVHLRYFMHLDTAAEGGWQVIGLAFSLVLLVVVLVGSIWVMEHLHANMMMTPASNVMMQSAG